MLKYMKPLSSEGLPESFFRTYDHHAPDCTRELQTMARQSHETCPVFRSDSHGGFHVVTRYDDIMEVVRNPAVFSSRRGFEIPEHRAPSLIPFHYDPPEATEYRRLLNPHFSPKAVADLRDTVRAIALRRIEEKRHLGRLDVIADLARPITASIILTIIGFDPELWAEYAVPYHDLVFRLVPPDAAYRQLYALSQRIAADIRRFREAPIPGTLMADLLAREFQGRPLTDEELGSIVATLLSAGSETAQASVGTAVVYLDENPDQRRRLLDEPALIPGAVEEFLRVLSAQPCIARTVTTDTMLAGVRLRKGDKVLLSWAAGNLDRTRFPSPFEVDFRRHPNPHLSFGAGIHKCLGMHLARMEIAVCVQLLLGALPGYRVRHDQLRLAPDCSLIFGFESVPIEFDAA
ncbi:cytochrome P450 [Inquilinus limosus]|uniref:cytochrome P450 n=1 Tax=Inquilinus limosus TaxID=171674 RepID=UPI003F1845B7